MATFHGTRQSGLELRGRLIKKSMLMLAFPWLIRIIISNVAAKVARSRLSYGL